MIRVFEEKREEEAAPEQSLGRLAYRFEEHVPTALFLYGVIVLAAFAGATLRLGIRAARARDRRRRRPRPSTLPYTGGAAHDEPCRAARSRSLSLVLSVTGVADAARQAAFKVVSKPRPNAVLKLDKRGKFPAKAIPKVASAQDADRVGGKTADDLTGDLRPPDGRPRHLVLAGRAVPAAQRGHRQERLLLRRRRPASRPAASCRPPRS